MSGAWFFGLAAVVNAGSVGLLVWTARNLRRVREERHRLRRAGGNARVQVESPGRRAW